MAFNPLSSDLAIVWNVVAMIISLVGVMAVVFINSIIQEREIFSVNVTRKLVHIFAAPVFVVSWLLFAGVWHDRFFAMVIPIVFVVMFSAIGSGRMKNEAFVTSMSRSGDARELLYGTLFYAIVILLAAVFWFYNPGASAGSTGVPTALVFLGCLAGGDGLADIIGRKLGKFKFTVGESTKSVEGSLGMLFGSVVFTLVLMAIFNLAGAGLDLVALLPAILIVSVVATVLEAVSPKNIDNWTIVIGVIVVLAILNWAAPDLWPYTLFGSLFGGA